MIDINKTTGISQEHIEKYLTWEASPADMHKSLGIKGIIYLIFNTYDNKGYIGKTINTFNYRYSGGKWWINHKHQPANILLDKVVRKYGYTQFKIFILEHNITDKQLIRKREKYWAKLLNTYAPNGYNIRECGEGSEFYGPMHEDHKKKLRDSNLKIYKIKNIKTGEIIIINDLPKWCQENHEPYYNIQGIIHGKLFIYHGFCLPETNPNNPPPQKPRRRRKYDKIQTIIKCIKTNTVIKIEDLHLWCIENKIEKNVILDMINGRYRQSQGYCLPDTDIALTKEPLRKRKTYQIVRISNGEILTINNMPKFCKENNIRLYTFRVMLRGQQIQSHGFCLPDKNLQEIKYKQTYKSAILLNPEGQLIKIERNIKQFCKENGLDASSLHHLARNKRKMRNHKGWLVVKWGEDIIRPDLLK